MFGGQDRSTASMVQCYGWHRHNKAKRLRFWCSLDKNTAPQASVLEIRVIQRRAQGLRYEAPLPLKIRTCILWIDRL
jgi:hypothetical protein